MIKLTFCRDQYAGVYRVKTYRDAAITMAIFNCNGKGTSDVVKLWPDCQHSFGALDLVEPEFVDKC